MILPSSISTVFHSRPTSLCALFSRDISRCFAVVFLGPVAAGRSVVRGHGVRSTLCGPSRQFGSASRTQRNGPFIRPTRSFAPAPGYLGQCAQARLDGSDQASVAGNPTASSHAPSDEHLRRSRAGARRRHAARRRRRVSCARAPAAPVHQHPGHMASVANACARVACHCGGRRWRVQDPAPNAR